MQSNAGPTMMCQVGTCHNGGICVQQWSHFYCDCNMTSYSGKLCNESSLGLLFVHPSGGLISMMMSDGQKKSSKKDSICFGLQTNYNGNAVIVRLASKTSGDFNNGYMVVNYNMGKSTHCLDTKMFNASSASNEVDFIDGKKYRLNDNRYHVVRFARSAQNASLIIDDLPPVSYHPTGR
ncbi:hypothetical protein HELRODRAFT_62081 [Helobdella robusta]|uniref:EGF-like domain-containing protein n=1 Tax=Helobdella robusta TaxID=6412 RepID=T1FWV4_HELRO|nr:hypothetical protein HELRODRAFT_62081 [Helobdella robusta]ESO12656.1 hypothetical protein HELRODRAFT_62081 [Helobdella robusta]